MKRMHFSWVIVLLWVSASAAWSSPALVARPTTPRPGEAVFITMTVGKALERASCGWGKKTYAFLPRGEQYEVILPVSAGTKPGAHRAKVMWLYADGERGERVLPITVKSRKFTTQHLKLSAAQESTYDDPAVAREYQLIGEALDLVTSEARWQESFLMPLQGRVSTSYGLQRYVNGHFTYRHKGMDIAAPMGTPVKAAADGIVALADDSFLLHGQTIILDHGHGVQTLYLHLSQIEVSPGDQVTQGQVIGRVGDSGVATGPHLHYGVYVHHEAMDPLFWTRLPTFSTLH